jgi:hypothetical protein
VTEQQAADLLVQQRIAEAQRAAEAAEAARLLREQLAQQQR